MTNLCSRSRTEVLFCPESKNLLNFHVRLTETYSRSVFFRKEKFIMKRMLSVALAIMLFAQGAISGTVLAKPVTTAGEVQILTSDLSLTSTIPAKNAGGVGTGSTFSMEFGEEIILGQGNILVKAMDNNQTITIPSSNITINGKQATFLVPGLSRGTVYYVLIDEGVFTSKDGSRKYAGIKTSGIWEFETEGGSVVRNSTQPNNETIGIRNPVLKMEFNKIVKPGSGKITIFRSDNNAAVYSIDVQSSSVTGFNTKLIDIRLPNNLDDNTSYYVQVEPGTFLDSYNNAFAGITDKSTWTFRVNTDSSAPTLVSVSPSATSNVPLNSSFVIRMSEAVTIDANAIRLKRSNTVVPSTATVNGSQITIRPQSSLSVNSNYSIEFTNGAVKDLSGNAYTGNSTVWTFSTIVPDTTPPVLQTARMLKSDAIELNYSKPLNSSSVPLASSFKVTVNDEERPLSVVSVSGNNVIIYLQSGVAIGQVVKVSYTQSGNPLMDSSGNRASNFSLREVTNEVENSMSKLNYSIVMGNVIQLTFNETLKTVDEKAVSQFIITVDGVQRTPTAVVGGGNSLTLTMSQPITDGQVVTLQYIPGQYPLVDRYESNLMGFGPIYIRNSIDTKAPVLVSTQVDGNRLILNYNEGINPEFVPMKSYYSVLVNDKARFVNKVEIKNNQVILTLASSVSSKNDAVTLSYIPGFPRVMDLSGNQAGAFSLLPVGNVTDSSLPQVNKSTVSGNVITLEFNKQLDNANVPATSYFTVRADSSSRGVNRVQVNNTIVTLTLSETVTSSQNVYVTYNVPSSKYLVDMGGNKVRGFTVQPSNSSSGSTNTGTTGTTVTMPGYLSQASSSLFLKDLLLFNTSQARKTTDRSLSGQYVNRYSVDDADWKTAMQYAVSKGHDVVAVDLSGTESAAIVAFPFKSVAEMASASSSNQDLRIGVRYGNWLYTIALKDIDISGITGSLGTAASNVTLLMQIDKQSGTLGSSLVNTIRSSSGSVIVDPYQFQVSAYTSTPTANSKVLEVTTEISHRITQSIVKEQTSAVRLDTSTANKLIYVPSQVITENGAIVLNAEVSKTGTIAIARGNKSFTDVGSHWAASDINALASRFIVDAYSGNKFEPNKAITRAEFAVFVVKALGLDGDASQAMRFSDVSQSSPAAPYIGAAVKAGIITGVSTNKFQPNSLITREQMAIMMSRAMTAAGSPVSLNGSSSSYLYRFTDYKSINGTATDAVARMVYADIITGMSGNKFGPKAQASRAQAAVMIRRMMASIGYL